MLKQKTRKPKFGLRVLKQEIMKYLTCLLLLLFFSIQLYSQKITIKDASTQENIDYAVIKDLKTKKRILTDSIGDINLSKDAPIVISCLGFLDKTIQHPFQKDVIYLRPKTQTLQQVTLTDKPKINQEYGFHNAKKRSFQISNVEKKFYPSVYIDNPEINNEGKIYKIFLKLKSKKNAQVRLHLYSFDRENGKIQKEILNKNSILKIDNTRKTREIDISDLNLSFPKNGLLIAIELLENTDSIEIAIGDSDKNVGQTFYVNPTNLDQPISIPMGNNKLSYMFGLSVLRTK